MLSKITLLVGLLFIVVSSHAAGLVESRLGGAAIYDIDRDITWLANANFIGGKAWNSALTDIQAINASGLLGFSDWRLPTTPLNDPTCPNVGNNGPGCTGSELGHLFYSILGGAPNTSILDVHGSNFELFSNIQNEFYWSGTENLAFPGPFAFRFQQGVQDASNNYDSPYFSWLVRSGDVTPIPLPNSIYLIVIGSMILGSLSRKAHTLTPNKPIERTPPRYALRRRSSAR